MSVLDRLNAFLPAIKQANETLVQPPRQSHGDATAQDNDKYLEVHDGEEEDDVLDSHLHDEDDEHYIDMV